MGAVFTSSDRSSRNSYRLVIRLEGNVVVEKVDVEGVIVVTPVLTV